MNIPPTDALLVVSDFIREYGDPDTEFEAVAQFLRDVAEGMPKESHADVVIPAHELEEEDDRGAGVLMPLAEWKRTVDGDYARRLLNRRMIHRQPMIHTQNVARGARQPSPQSIMSCILTSAAILMQNFDVRKPLAVLPFIENNRDGSIKTSVTLFGVRLRRPEEAITDLADHPAFPTAPHLPHSEERL